MTFHKIPFSTRATAVATPPALAPALVAAIAALALPLGAGPARAQTIFQPPRQDSAPVQIPAQIPGQARAPETGFSVEITPSADGYAPVRVGTHVFGPVSEPASAYVRGCRGQVMPEAAGVPFDLTGPMPTLAFTGAGEGLISLVLGTPDGLYRCALADDQGMAVTQFADPQPGRYTVWLGAAQGATIDARLIAADQPVSPIELFGFDVARLGEPRNGRMVFAATTDSGRQELVQGATLFAQSDMRPLNPDSCVGFGRFDAADAVLTLDQATDRFSIFATSQTDLTMAVVTPSGQVLCNDDSFQLNPAITIDQAEAGDYQIFVGGYAQGEGGRYDLFASAGAPIFTNAVLNLDGAPRAGRVVFDPAAAATRQTLATGPIAARDPMDALGAGDFCPGFTDISAPDLVLTLDAAQPELSVYATSETDLVLAVRAPDGGWLCNDDSHGLNPAVSFGNAQPGDYLVFVGAYDPDAAGRYTLLATAGAPDWNGAASNGGAPSAAPVLHPMAEPAVGRLSFGPETRLDPRVIFDILPSQIEAQGMGDGCAGFITPTQPDLVINAEPGLPQLMVYMTSEADGTLVVQAPDGRIWCNDDFEQLNPAVMIPNPMPGDYAVFAGSYDGQGGVATLGVTIANPLWMMDREP